jgi:hypothetical protein
VTGSGFDAARNFDEGLRGRGQGATAAPDEAVADRDPREINRELNQAA